jgi:pimeloyl-[acyl-carrier protein] methyl ester esterase
MSIVLLRGLTRGAWHWQEFPALLRQTFPNEQIVTPEIAGTGYRSTETSPSSISDMVADIRAQLSAQKINGRHQRPNLTLIGVSMGGMIAAEWAHQYPEEIEQLHLINSSFACFSQPWQRMRPAAFLFLTGALWYLARSSDVLEDRILKLSSNLPIRPELKQSWQAFARQHPISLGNGRRQIEASSQYWGLTTPPIEQVALYVSKGDRMVAPRCSKAIAEHWQAPLIQHPWAGHDLSLDDPEWLTQQLKEQISKRSASADPSVTSVIHTTKTTA